MITRGEPFFMISKPRRSTRRGGAFRRADVVRARPWAIATSPAARLSETLAHLRTHRVPLFLVQFAVAILVELFQHFIAVEAWSIATLFPACFSQSATFTRSGSRVEPPPAAS